MASLVLLAGGAAAAWQMRVTGAESAGVVAAADAAAPVAGEVKRSLVLASLQDITEALISAGVSPEEAQAATKAAAAVMSAPGEVHATITLVPDGKAFQLIRLDASYADGSGAVIARNSDGAFVGSAVAAELTKQVKVLRGELDSESFYNSAVTAGVLDTLIPEFINAFGYDFNLASEVQAGDTFEVAYEQTVNPNGDPVGQPQLLFASLTTKAKSVALYRYVGPDGTVGWYDGNGASTKRGLMRTPVDGARITSNFGMRFHPVLHYNRLHAGVDFGVPIGTPVYAAADGVVTGATPTGCGGNMAVQQHDNGWVTRYFHLSRYAEGLHEGQRVTQGFTIGLSGTTGTCTTGPHLHYELRINGEPVDPLSVKTDDNEKKKLDPAVLQAFMRQRDRVDVARAQQAV
jgi:murein DD-endopeptidase MepM/ murein hydrolase activator NlpD